MSDGEPITELTLSHPIEFGNETISTLTFRPATGADLEDFPINGATIKDYMRIAARLTERPITAFRKASGPDTFAIAAAVESQLASGPPTGGT